MKKVLLKGLKKQKLNSFVKNKKINYYKIKICNLTKNIIINWETGNKKYMLTNIMYKQ